MTLSWWPCHKIVSVTFTFTFNMTVCGADVRPVDCVRDLGVLIDSNMTLSNHVNNVAGICFYQLCQLRIIRRSLTTDAAHLLVRALIHTRVDYCNGPKYLHEKLKSDLRAAARLVLQLPHRASVSEIMRGHLHWQWRTWGGGRWGKTPRAALWGGRQKR